LTRRDWLDADDATVKLNIRALIEKAVRTPLRTALRLVRPHDAPPTDPTDKPEP